MGAFMEFNSIAMIETNGLVSAITALEAMLKLGNIKLLKRETISNGQVAIFVSGNTPHLTKVLQVGENVANNVGNVIATSIIENPTKEILDVILESGKSTTKSKRTKKKNVEVEKTETLFDSIIEDAILEEATKPNTDKKVIVEEDILEVEPVSSKEVATNTNIEEVLETERDDEIVVDNLFVEEDVLELEDDSAVAIEKIEDKSSVENKIIEEEVIEEKQVEVSETIDVIEENLSEDKKETFEVAEPIAKVSEVINEVVSKEESSLEISEVEEENLIANKTPTDEVVEEITEEITESEDEKVEVNDFSSLTHLERLRAEAKSELEVNSKSSLIEEALKESVESNKDDSELSSMNVPQLRKLARSNPNFPIQGREISKANRKVLLEYFKEIL